MHWGTETTFPRKRASDRVTTFPRNAGGAFRGSARRPRCCPRRTRAHNNSSGRSAGAEQGRVIARCPCSAAFVSSASLPRTRVPVQVHDSDDDGGVSVHEEEDAEGKANE